MRDTPLSQVDAFFVAYQEQSGILMQLGAEADIVGSFSENHVQEMLHYVVTRWPQLGQRLTTRAFGLAWSGQPTTEGMFRLSRDVEELDRWRNSPINPFTEPAFQVLWVPASNVHHLYFRGHHAATDGESFLYVTKEALRALASSCGGIKTDASVSGWLTVRQGMRKAGQVRFSDVWRFVKYISWLRKEAQSSKSASLWMRACTPGDIGQCERVFEDDLFIHFNRLAAEKKLSPLWLATAAWIQAIHLWNTAKGNGHRSTVSLEFPVSLRQNRNEGAFIGNLLSPLILYEDGSKPLAEIAFSLRRQFFSGIRRRLHLAVPYCTMLGGKLPWPLFKRIAINTSTTGFATSHFTWLPQEDEFLDDMIKFSNGQLRIARQKFYTPVCLHMGAALSVLSLRHRAKFCITYRRTALTEADADLLADFLVDAALQKHVAREEVTDRDYSYPALTRADFSPARAH